MTGSLITSETFLHKIRGDPDAAVAKQRLIPASVTNIVISKHMRGIFDRMDQLH